MFSFFVSFACFSTKWHQVSYSGEEKTWLGVIPLAIALVSVSMDAATLYTSATYEAWRKGASGVPIAYFHVRDETYSHSTLLLVVGVEESTKYALLWMELRTAFNQNGLSPRLATMTTETVIHDVQL